jgi:hypothetical protein
MFYKCEIYVKIGAREVFVSRVQTELYNIIFRLGFLQFCLTLSQFGNAITSQILGVSLCMSTSL